MNRDFLGRGAREGEGAQERGKETPHGSVTSSEAAKSRRSPSARPPSTSTNLFVPAAEADGDRLLADASEAPHGEPTVETDDGSQGHEERFFHAIDLDPAAEPHVGAPAGGVGLVERDLGLESPQGRVAGDFLDGLADGSDAAGEKDFGIGVETELDLLPSVDSAVVSRRGDFASHLLLTGVLETVRSTQLTAPCVPMSELYIRWIEEDGAYVRAGQKVLEFEMLPSRAPSKTRSSPCARRKKSLVGSKPRVGPTRGRRRSRFERKKWSSRRPVSSLTSRRSFFPSGSSRKSSSPWSAPVGAIRSREIGLHPGASGRDQKPEDRSEMAHELYPDLPGILVCRNATGKVFSLTVPPRAGGDSGAAKKIGARPEPRPSGRIKKPV